MTAGRPGVRALSLDIWGTLLRSDPGFKPARNDLLRQAFAPERGQEAFDEAMRRADRDADEICMARGRDVGFAERVRLTLRRFEAPVPAALDEQVPGLMAAQRRLALEHPPRPLHTSLPKVVTELTRRMPVVLTSNTGMLPGVLMRELLQAAGFSCRTGEVFSDETGWAKPDGRIFAQTWSLVREHLREPSTPHDVLHVGDNPCADVDGAAAFGMQTVLVAPDGDSTLEVLEQVMNPGGED